MECRRKALLQGERKPLDAMKKMFGAGEDGEGMGGLFSGRFRGSAAEGEAAFLKGGGSGGLTAGAA